MAAKPTGRPSLAVLGVGDYYSKLRHHIWRYFAPAALIDTNPKSVQSLPQEQRSIFRHLSAPRELNALISLADLVMILTPNDTHALYAAELAKARKAIVIEKPIATSADDLQKLRALVDSHWQLYFSDFYVDVRAIPLLLTAGRLQPGDWRRELVRGDLASIPAISDIGLVRRVDGRIDESYPFRGDSWVGKKPAGGVIFDLMIHLFALLRCLFPDEQLVIKKCQRLSLSSFGPPAHYVKMNPDSEAAEAFALFEGVLVPSQIEVLFEVAKSTERHERHFTIEGTRGLISQRFEQNHPLTLVTSAKNVSLALDGDRYELTCRAIRQWYDAGAKTYGWDWSSWAAEKAIEARIWSPVQSTTIELRPAERQPIAFSETVKPSRREFFLLAGTFLAASVSAARDAHEEYEKFKDTRNIITLDFVRLAERSERWLDSKRIARISTLVGTHERIVFAPGTEHLYGRATWDPEASLRAYPHDQNAVAPFRYLTGLVPEVVELDGIPGCFQAGDVAIATGSPTSSILARYLMTPDSSFAINNLPYRIGEIDADPFVRVISGMEGGKESKKRGKELCAFDDPAVCYSDLDNVDNSGWLKKDILLVSRLPGVGGDFDVLLLSGFHGAGTQAAELLFRKDILSEEDLEKLYSVLNRGRYWQFVLEVGDLSHKQPMTTAHSIRLSPFCPPRVFFPKERGNED